MPFIKSIHKKSIIFILIVFCTFPSILTAKVFITTQIAYGQVVSITKENTIELDDGFLYYPAKKDTPCSVKPGEFISIRYFIDANDKKNYIEYAPGENSLKPVPLPKSTTKPKTML